MSIRQLHLVYIIAIAVDTRNVINYFISSKSERKIQEQQAENILTACCALLMT